MRSVRGRFWRIAGAGAAFQAGAAAIDSATVVASLVFQLTGSAFAVGFASALLRLGWLPPQLIVGYLAERAERRMPFYVVGAYLYRALMNRVQRGDAVHKGKAYPGEHQAIIDEQLWDTVHAILRQNPRKRANNTRAQAPASSSDIQSVALDSTNFAPQRLRNQGKSSPAPAAPPENRIAPNAKQRLAPFWATISPAISSF